MAALRLGIGDVFTITKTALDLCAKVTTTNHEEMKDVRLLVAEMEMMREHLSTIQQNISITSEKGRIGGSGGVEKDVAPLMTRSLLPIQKDLVSLHQTLQIHQSRKQSCHVLDQARYMLHYHDQLSAFKESIPRHRESICVMRDIVEGDIHDGENEVLIDAEQEESERRSRRESVMKLAGIVEREEAKQEDDAYNQQWLNESSHLRNSIETVMEEARDDEPENDYTLSSSSSNSNLTSSPNPLSKKLSFTPFSTFPKAALLGTKPTFKLDIFETFSCTNTPRSSPPLETASLEP